MSVKVNSLEELKQAIKAGNTEIISYDKDLVQKLKTIKKIKSYGPAVVGGIIAAIPVIALTGPFGAGALGIIGASEGISTSVIVGMIVVIGGTIVISLFTDWEYVEIGADGIKLRRK